MHQFEYLEDLFGELNPEQEFNIHQIESHVNQKISSLIDSSTNLDECRLHLLLNPSSESPESCSVGHVYDAMHRVKLFSSALVQCSNKFELTDNLLKLWIRVVSCVVPQDNHGRENAIISLCSRILDKEIIYKRIVSLLEIDIVVSRSLPAASVIVQALHSTCKPIAGEMKKVLLNQLLTSSLSGKSIPNGSRYLIGLCVDEELMRNVLLPSISKAVLRSGETQMPVVCNLLRHLRISVDSCVGELSQVVVKYLSSSSSDVRQATSQTLAVIASKLTEADSYTKLVRLIYDHATGPDCRRLGKDATLGGLACIGLIAESCASSLKSTSPRERVATATVGLLADFISSEPNEESVITATVQMSLWLKVFKSNLPERFYSLIKTKALNVKCDPSVRCALLAALNDGYSNVNLATKLPSSILPSLVLSIQRGLNQPNQSPLVHEALVSSLMWLRYTTASWSDDKAKQIQQQITTSPLWTLLTGIGVTAVAKRRPWFSRRFLQSAPDYVLRCLAHLIVMCLTRLLDCVPDDCLDYLCRTLVLLCLHPNYKTVRQSTVSCLNSCLEQTSSLPASTKLRCCLLTNLFACCQTLTSADAVQTTTNDPEGSLRDLAILDRLWSESSSCTGSNTTPGEEVGVNANLLIQVISCLTVGHRMAVDCTGGEAWFGDVDVSIASLFACSHPLIVRRDPKLWERLMLYTSLSVGKLIASGDRIDFLTGKWSTIIDQFVGLESLDKTYTTALRRLFTWSPDGFGKQLLTTVHDRLSSDDLLKASGSEVLIMLTQPNQLCNTEILVGLPEYQSVLDSIGGFPLSLLNAGRLPYSYRAWTDDSETFDQLSAALNSRVDGDGPLLSSLIDQLKGQLTEKQLELIREELGKEAVVRQRLEKLEAGAYHLNTLLAAALSSMNSLPAASIHLDLRLRLLDLLTRQLASPLTSPHSLHPYMECLRCFGLSDPLIHWSLRLLEPARLLTSWPQAASTGRQLLSAWASLSIEDQTKESLKVLSDKVLSSSSSASCPDVYLLLTGLHSSLTVLLLASGWARPLFDEQLPHCSLFAPIVSPCSLQFITLDVNTRSRVPVASIQSKFAWLDGEQVKSMVSMWSHLLTPGDTAHGSGQSHLLAALSFEALFKLFRQLIDGCLSPVLTDDDLDDQQQPDDELDTMADSMLDGDEVVELRDRSLAPLLVTLMQSTGQLVANSLKSSSPTVASDSLTKVIQSLSTGLVATSVLAREACCRCLLILSETLPDLMTLLPPLPDIANKSAASKPAAADVVVEEVVNGDGDDDDIELNDSAAPELADSAPAKAKLSKSQRRKLAKVRAAAAATTDAAKRGEEDSTTNGVYPSSACWPQISAAQNLQLRLWVGRCDAEPELASLCDRIWTGLNLDKACEQQPQPDSSDLCPLLPIPCSANLLLLDRQKLIHRLTLEATRSFPPDLQQANANALALACYSTSADRQSAGDVNQVATCLNELIRLYRVYLFQIPAEYDTVGRLLKAESPDLWRQRLGLVLVMNRLNEIYAPSRKSDELDASNDKPVSLRPGLKTAASVVEPQSLSNVSEAWLLDLFRFLVPGGLNDRHARVRSEMLQTGLRACAVYGKAFKSKLFPILESFLSKAPNTADYDVVRQSILILTGHLSRHLEAEDPKVVSVFNRLLGTINFPSAVVQQAVEDCLVSLVGKLPEEQVSKTVTRLMNSLLNSSVYAERHGAAHGLSGVVRGLGIMSLKQYEIMDRLLPALDDAKSAKRREGALLGVQRLCLGMGRLFEPYVVRLISSLLNCFGDTNANVRETASQTARAVMSQLSAHGVKLILPTLLRNIDEQQSWRTKAESVNLLAAMTNCAPKQLSACLPQIVPRLLEVLVDSQDKVKEAGVYTLNRIAGVIRNPEVQALIPVLTKCLQDPLLDKMPCLLALRDTCFVHALDAPSLALILPVIQRAFAERSTEVRKTAAQILGNLHSLARAEDLQPYVGNLLPPLKATLMDAIPEVRSVAAAALGALVRGIGESMFKDILPWLMKTMTSETSSVDRSGAAQGLAEVLGGMGIDRLRSILPELIHTASSESNLQPCVRDGYLMLFIYLPVVFQRSFTEFLGPIIPPILRSLSDETEFIRETALRAAQRIIQVFGETTLDILLPELEVGLSDANWRIRLSSVQLLGDLLYQISGTSGKGTTETVHDDETFGSSYAYDKLKISLGSQERHDRVLGRLHMARADLTQSVRQAAAHVWKIVVPNTSRTLREIMPTLIQLLLDCLGSHSREQQQLAARSLGDVVRKLGERVVPELLPLLVTGLDSPDGDRRRGVCIGLAEIIRNCPKEQLPNYTDGLVNPTRRALCDELAEVRRAGARTFDLLYSGIGVRCLDGILPPLMAQLTAAKSDDVDDQKHEEQQALALEALRQLMLVKSQVVMPHLVNQLIHPIVNVEVFAYLASVSGDSLCPHLPRILPALLNTVAQLEDPSVDCEQLKKCAEIIASISSLSSVRLIVNELLTSIGAASTSQASSILTTTTTAAKRTDDSTSESNRRTVSAALRLLHAYLEATFESDDLDSQAAIGRQQPPPPAKPSRPAAETSDDDEDSDDDDEEEDEEDDDMDSSDEDSEDEGEDDDDEDDDDAPNPKESVDRVLREYYPLALRNICRLLAWSDAQVLRYTWNCLESLFKRWTPDTITTQVSDLRQGVRGAISDLNKSLAAASPARASAEVALPGFADPGLPIVGLVRLYADCTLRGRVEIREPASQALAEALAYSTGTALQRCVVKVIGPLIRLLGERQTNVVRLAVVEALTLLVNKCPQSSRPFVTQLQTTFAKCLGDRNRSMRLLGGKGLASIVSITPKLDPLLTDLGRVSVQAVLAEWPGRLVDSHGMEVPTDLGSAAGASSMALTLAGVASYPETSLCALDLCLIGSRGRASPAALNALLSCLKPLLYVKGKSDSARTAVDIDDESADGSSGELLDFDAVRIEASRCIGAVLACLTSNEQAIDQYVLSVVKSTEKLVADQWTLHQSQCLMLLQVVTNAPSLLIHSNLLGRCLSLIYRLCSSEQISVCHLAFCCLAGIIAALASSSEAPPASLTDPLAMISNFAKGLSHSNVKLRTALTSNLAYHVAWSANFNAAAAASTDAGTNHLLSSAWLSSWLGHVLLAGCKDKAANVRLGAETSLAVFCRLGMPTVMAEELRSPTGSAVAQRCLAAIDPVNRIQLEPAIPRLRKQNWADVWRSGCPSIDTSVFLIAPPTGDAAQ